MATCLKMESPPCRKAAKSDDVEKLLILNERRPVHMSMERNPSPLHTMKRFRSSCFGLQSLMTNEVRPFLLKGLLVLVTTRRSRDKYRRSLQSVGGGLSVWKGRRILVRQSGAGKAVASSWAEETPVSAAPTGT